MGLPCVATHDFDRLDAAAEAAQRAAAKHAARLQTVTADLLAAEPEAIGEAWTAASDDEWRALWACLCDAYSFGELPSIETERRQVFGAAMERILRELAERRIARRAA